MNAKITVVGPSIKIGGFTCEKLGKLAAKTIDLTPYAGQHVRVWLDQDGSYSLDPRSNHYWQIAEFDVPEIGIVESDSGEVGEAGEPVMIREVLPLELIDVEFTVWPLPA
ncbi:MAG: hypothetical protein WC322_02365 [Candidatus Paceibacterota bacterium]|jgi:hypothetical protein